MNRKVLNLEAKLERLMDRLTRSWPMKRGRSSAEHSLFFPSFLRLILLFPFRFLLKSTACVGSASASLAATAEETDASAGTFSPGK